MLHNVVRLWPRLLGLVVLAALLGAAVVTVSLARAAPPGDLALTLSLVEDSDDIVPPGSTLRVAAALTFTSRRAHLADVPGGTLRISGAQEWEAGRNSLSITRQPGYTATTAIGRSVAVQEDADGDIVVVGAPTTTADNIRGAGAVDVYVGGRFVTRLVGDPTLNAAPHVTVGPGGVRLDSSILSNGAFGASVDVASDVIVVGAPSEGSRTRLEDGSTVIRHQPGAAYVFERDSDGIWTRSAKLVVGTANPDRPDRDVNRLYLAFGHSVAISDDGNTIVVGQQPISHLAASHHWGATGHVFTRPSDGWSDMTTDDSTVVSLRYDGDEANADPDDAASVASRARVYGDVEISGDGSVVTLGGAVLPTSDDLYDAPGAALLFMRPSGGWSDAGGTDGMLEQDVELTAHEDGPRSVQVGEALATNSNGSVIVSSGSGALSAWLEAERSQEARDWPGAAFVWVKPNTGWVDTDGATATLSDSTAVRGDLFGITVAISDSGALIMVGDNIDDALHVFRKPTGGWEDDASADHVLLSRRVEDVWGPSGRPGVALDGESTAVLGQTSRTGVRDALLVHTGRVFALDLAAADLEMSAMPLGSCSNVTVDGVVNWTCPIDAGDTLITIPLGTPDGTFTISGVLTVDGVEYSDTLEVTIDEVNEVTEVQFGFAEYESGLKLGERYPDAIAAGETTRLRLGVLNEHGKASAGGSIASVLFTTTVGSLSTSIGGGCMGGGGLVCQIPVSALTAANADKIDLTVAHPGRGSSGAAEIRATVLAVDGETFNADPLRVTLTGEAALLAISEPATSVLNVHTEDFDAERDDRDVLTLTVRATDEEGRKAAVPTHSRRVVITGPDGRRVEAGSPYDPASLPALIVAWPKVGGSFAPHLGAPRTAAELLGSYDVVNKWSLGIGWQWYSVDANGQPARGATNFVASDGDVLRFDDLVLDADGNLQVELDVDASRANPLTPGEYTLELRAGGLTARRSFSVVGDTAALTLSEATGSTEDGGRLSLTATLADGDGNAVADGTPVVWEEGNTAAQVVLVQLSVEATTTDGRASATYLVVGRGAAWVRASSGEAGDTRVMFNLGAPPTPPAPANPAESLSSRTPGALAAWLGSGATSAAALLAGLDGIDAIAVWRNGAWLRYEAAGDGVDFEVRRGEVLRLGG